MAAPLVFLLLQIFACAAAHQSADSFSELLFDHGYSVREKRQGSDDVIRTSPTQSACSCQFGKVLATAPYFRFTVDCQSGGNNNGNNGNNNGDNGVVIPGGLVPIPDDSYIGTVAMWVICAKQDPGSVPTWDWLYIQKGTYAKVMGTWETISCTYGSVTVFHISKAAYLRVVKMCQDIGYVTAQPSDSKFGGWFPFKIGNVLGAYYYKADFTKLGVYFPTTVIPPCGNGNGNGVVIPDESFNGGDTTYLICVKSGGSWDWLYKSKGIMVSTYYQVQGLWIKHLCGFGYVESFRISTKDYNTYLAMCKNQGYETLQVARTANDVWHPIQVANVFVETYIKSIKYVSMIIPDCVTTGAGVSNNGIISSSNSNDAGDSSLATGAPLTCSFPGSNLAVNEERAYQGYVYSCKVSSGGVNVVAIACLEGNTDVRHPPGDTWTSGDKPHQYVFKCSDAGGKLKRQVIQCVYDAADGKGTLEPDTTQTFGKTTVKCRKTGDNQLNIDITTVGKK